MLNEAQRIILAAEVNADPAFASLPHNSDGAFVVAAALNLVAVPDYWVWRTRVPLSDITENGFTWTLVDGLSPGTARIWEWMFDNSERSINPAKANVRQGIADVWDGTAAKLVLRETVLGHCKRLATRTERLLATGAGTQAIPATMGYEGSLSYDDVQQAMGW